MKPCCVLLPLLSSNVASAYVVALVGFGMTGCEPTPRTYGRVIPTRAVIASPSTSRSDDEEPPIWRADPPPVNTLRAVVLKPTMTVAEVEAVRQARRQTWIGCGTGDTALGYEMRIVGQPCTVYMTFYVGKRASGGSGVTRFRVPGFVYERRDGQFVAVPKPNESN